MYLTCLFILGVGKDEFRLDVRTSRRNYVKFRTL